MKKLAQFSTDIIWRSWVVLGPLSLLLTIVAAFAQLHGTLLAIPMIALAGLILTHLWGWRGLLATAALLGVASMYMFTAHPHNLAVWNALLAFACLCALAVARLGFDEYEASVSERFLKAERDVLAIKELKHSLQVREEGHQEEIGRLRNSIESLKGDLYKSVEALGVKEHLLGLTLDEMNVVDGERQRLMKSVIELQRDSSDHQKTIEHLKAQLEENAQQHTVVQELTDYIETLQKEKLRDAESLERKFDPFKTKIAELQKENSDAALKHQAELQELSQTIEQLRNENRKLSDDFKTLTEEVANGRETRRIQGFYNQLREQFEEKNKVLENTRRELFAAQEKIAAAEKDLELRELTANKAHEKHCNAILSEAAEEIERIENESREEIAQLQAVIESLMESTQKAMV